MACPEERGKGISKSGRKEKNTMVRASRDHGILFFPCVLGSAQTDLRSGPPQREYIFHHKRERKAPNGDNYCHQTGRLIVRGDLSSLCSDVRFSLMKE